MRTRQRLLSQWEVSWPVDTSIALRSHEQLAGAYRRIERLREEIAQAEDDEPYAPVHDGEAAALAWVLGRSAVSPVMGRQGPKATDVHEIERERQAATRMLQGEDEMDSRGQSYVVGAESALMWACGLSDTPL